MCRCSGLPPVAAAVPIKGRFGACRVSNAEARFADPFISGWIQDSRLRQVATDSAFSRGYGIGDRQLAV